MPNLISRLRVCVFSRKRNDFVLTGSAYRKIFCDLNDLRGLFKKTYQDCVCDFKRFGWSMQAVIRKGSSVDACINAPILVNLLNGFLKIRILVNLSSFYRSHTGEFVDWVSIYCNSCKFDKWVCRDSHSCKFVESVSIDSNSYKFVEWISIDSHTWKFVDWVSIDSHSCKFVEWVSIDSHTCKFVEWVSLDSHTCKFVEWVSLDSHWPCQPQSNVSSVSSSQNTRCRSCPQKINIPFWLRSFEANLAWRSML
jgi:hypothetical protein